MDNIRHVNGLHKERLDPVVITESSSGKPQDTIPKWITGTIQ